MNGGRQRLGWAIVIGSIAGLLLVGYAAFLDYQARTGPSPDEEIAGDTCCAPGAGPRRAPAAELPSDLENGEPQRGRAFYTVACANCHDDDGSGARGRPTYPGIQDLRNSARDQEQLAKAVLFGRGDMPAFGGLLDEDELRHLVAYVRSL